jgi:3-isopropylmalate/(R)-2-methylmalate dehydratase small subunit
MEPFNRMTGVVMPMNRVNVDTDQIIPKQFLKRVERTGFGEFLFFDWRYNDDGTPKPDFVLNQPGYKDAEIIVAGRNFGSGSSREHAPWALGQYGFKVVIAPSFADIFHNNCFQNGLLPIVLPEETVQQIIENAERDPGYRLHVDLEAERVWDDDEQVVAEFSVEPFRRHCLLNGLDDIGLTLEYDDDIAAFEANRGSHGGVLTI